MFRLGRIGKLMIAAQIGMKLFRMAKSAKAKSDQKKRMEIVPHKFQENQRAGIHKQ